MSDELMDRATGPRIGQATAIEQSRAVAEVLAQVELSLRMPRDPVQAVDSMRRLTALYPMAERAFWSFPRSGSTLTGSTVHLARELARCWRNVSYGIVEIDRDDRVRQSQMIAFAWDVEANVRSSTTFIVPWLKDTKGGPKGIVDLRDIYENNANMGARRVREQILSVLPRWYVDEAEGRCRKTLERGPDGSQPFEARVSAAVDAFDRIGVNVDQLAQHVGRGPGKWSPQDLVNVGIIYRSIERGEQTTDAVFGSPVTSETIRQGAAVARAVASQPATVGESGDFDPTTDPTWGDQS